MDTSEDGKRGETKGEKKGETKEGVPAPPARWKIVNVGADCGPVKLKRACVLNVHSDRFTKQEKSVRDIQAALRALVKEAEEHIPEVKDDNHLAPEKPSEGTAGPHLKTEEKQAGIAVKRLKEAISATQRIMPAIVASGKAKHRARVNAKRYEVTADAIEDRRKERKDETLAKRKQKRERALHADKDDD
jgi:hypothetical protein